MSKERHIARQALEAGVLIGATFLIGRELSRRNNSSKTSQEFFDPTNTGESGVIIRKGVLELPIKKESPPSISKNTIPYIRL